jgi:hypothetical protein
MERKCQVLLATAAFLLVLLVLLSDGINDLPPLHSSTKWGAAAVGYTDTWSDALLYTPAGNAHDAWKLIPRSQIAPLTAETQTFLTAHQFPQAGCMNARFLISRSVESGIGSNLHTATFHLSTAIELGRIFLWSDNAGLSYTDKEYCPRVRNYECFFRAPSSCTLEDALRTGADTVVVEGGSEHLGFSTGHVPAILRGMWAEYVVLSPRPKELKYWWRAQAVAFLARFNGATISTLYKLRTNISAIKYSPPGAGNEMANAFPLTRGTISMHIRHGDKGREMMLVADEAYFAAAEELVLMNPMGLARTAFISTEDPATIAVASEGYSDWAMMWYDLPRINSNGLDQLTRLPHAKGFLMHAWLLQLLMALECDAWVGTRGSNWNR